MGVITGWLSTGVDAINQFGAFGWWSAGLIGALTAAMLMFAVAAARYAWSHARARQKWSDRVDHFNPLDREIRKTRMNISDLAHPISRQIENKRLQDCELIGPANLFLVDGITLFGVGFVDCSIVVLWPNRQGYLSPGNSYIANNLEMHGGEIHGATILIMPQLVPDFKKMGAPFITLTGDPEIDNQWTPGRAEETQR